MTLAWRADRDGRKVGTGAWAALALAAKPFLGLLVVDWAIRRQGRTIVAAAVVGLGCLATGVAVFGVGATGEWVLQLREVQWAWGAMNGSVPGLVSRILADSPYHTPFVALPTRRRVVEPRAHPRDSRDLARGRADGGRGSSLGAPPARVPPLLAARLDLRGWILVGPLWLLWKEGRLWTPALWLVGPGLFAPPWLTLPTSSGIAALTIGSLYTWTYLGLWLAVLCGPADPRRERP